jgi:hypothetical protein
MVQDLSLPNLGLSLTGNVDVGLGYEFDLTFGVNKTQGFYVDTTKADEITVDLRAALPNLSATGKLGALQLTASDKGTLFNGSFAINLKDSNTDNRIYLCKSNG